MNWRDLFEKLELSLLSIEFLLNTVGFAFPLTLLLFHVFQSLIDIAELSLDSLALFSPLIDGLVFLSLHFEEKCLEVLPLTEKAMVTSQYACK